MLHDNGAHELNARRGAIVLAGGRSRRMGRDKAALTFGGETMLERVVRLVGQAVDRVCVVASPGQNLPPLPDGVALARDGAPDRGPLEGFFAGLRTLDASDVVFVTGCDAPLLAPKLIERLFDLLGEADAVVAFDADRDYPLLAVYRTTIRETANKLLQNNCLSMKSLLNEISPRRIPVDALRDVDPHLHSLRNVNSREDYLAALELAGLVDKRSTRPAGLDHD